MTIDQRPSWDRSADLRDVERAYAQYAGAGRSRLWDERNPGYARLAGELRGELAQLVRASMGTGVTRICDLGCGTGDLAGARAALGAPTDWVGIDLRAAAVDAARQTHPDARFLVASADAVPEPNASFDVIVAQVLFSSLPSIELERAVAREVGRLLRPSGSLLWVDIRYSNPSNSHVHGLSRGRIASLFPEWTVDLRAVGLLPPVARRLGRATPVLYPLLSSVPPLRSHYVGRLRPPAMTA